MSTTLTQFDADNAARPPEGVAIHAGFPNPAADAGYDARLSLDRLLIRHPSSSYFFRISGDNWAEQGIFDGDIALVDRALDARDRDLVVYWRDDEFMISWRTHLTTGETPWGVISAIIHPYHYATHLKTE